jgi:hypothetical protein
MAGEAIQGSNQKDPGSGTHALARAITAYNPDATWSKVPAPRPSRDAPPRPGPHAVLRRLARRHKASGKRRS